MVRENACRDNVWVFDFKVDEKTKKTPVMVPTKNIYKCKEVIEALLITDGDTHRDFSLVRLDRVVNDRGYLKYRKYGKIANHTELTVIGHPSGLPQKVTDKGQITANSNINYFETNLDSFGGNSGSPVFDSKTGIVEGILVRGAKDYNKDPSCGLRANRVRQNIAGSPLLGEGVSRITDIPSLNQGSKLLDMAITGNLTEIKFHIKEMQYMDFDDQAKNNALHLAIHNNHTHVAKFLMETKINLNAQNMQGETSLHLAAISNNYEVPIESVI